MNDEPMVRNMIHKFKPRSVGASALSARASALAADEVVDRYSRMMAWRLGLREGGVQAPTPIILSIYAERYREGGPC